VASGVPVVETEDNLKNLVNKNYKMKNNSLPSKWSEEVIKLIRELDLPHDREFYALFKAKDDSDKLTRVLYSVGSQDSVALNKSQEKKLKSVLTDATDEIVIESHYHPSNDSFNIFDASVTEEHYKIAKKHGKKLYHVLITPKNLLWYIDIEDVLKLVHIEWLSSATKHRRAAKPYVDKS